MSNRRVAPEAKLTQTPSARSSSSAMRSPNTYSVSAAVVCWMSPASVPRRISSSAVAPDVSPLDAGKKATVPPSSSTKAVPVSPVFAASAASSRPIRRRTSRPAPRTSTFCPSSRRWSNRSTTVVSKP